MRMTTAQLKRIIKEELAKAVSEVGRSGVPANPAKEKYLQAVENVREFLADPDLSEEDLNEIVDQLGSLMDQVELELGMDYPDLSEEDVNEIVDQLKSLMNQVELELGMD